MLVSSEERQQTIRCAEMNREESTEDGERLLQGSYRTSRAQHHQLPLQENRNPALSFPLRQPSEMVPEELFVAVGRGDVVEAGRIIDGGVNVNAVDQNSSTVLHLAAQQGGLDMVQLLLRKGADAQAKGKNNNTPLHLAAHNGHPELVRMLISGGALVEGINKNHNSPLHLAAAKVHMNVAEILLEEKATVDAKNKVLPCPAVFALE
ncbi:hypothetical protein CYMTET_28428 [Cymbomonas tetramitiformis]|uniref:Uncharacterized protein n=1 Tax=Cymbomonas tetramitiformis TaxID=36881 RepID=A0AAE0FMX7_9CHLO|nr:hypothetical protein CYMTET_28428 [Cymbomonas tetramitiformis]